MNDITIEQIRYNLTMAMVNQGKSSAEIQHELPKLLAVIYSDPKPEPKNTDSASIGESLSSASTDNPLLSPFSAYYFTAHQGVQGASMDSTGTARVSYGNAHPLNRIMVCVLVLKNGFIVTGTATGLSPEEAHALNVISESEEQLKKRAFENAVAELSGFEIYYNFELWKRQDAVAIQE